MGISIDGEQLKMMVHHHQIEHRVNAEGLNADWTLGDNPPGDGFMVYSIQKQSAKWGDYIEMRQIYVKSSERKLGVAKRLFLELEAIAKTEKIGKIYVDAWFGDEKTNPFYHFLLHMEYQALPQEAGNFNWVKYVE